LENRSQAATTSPPNKERKKEIFNILMLGEFHFIVIFCEKLKETPISSKKFNFFQQKKN
jgi:hypothetical protein